MGRLIIVVEHSSMGRRSITNHVISKSALNLVLVKKYTTRLLRNFEWEEIKDFNFVSREKAIKCTYSYAYRDNYYGINKEDIDIVLGNNKNPIIYVSNVNVIIALKRDFPDALVIYINDIIFHSALELNESIQKNRFFNDAEYMKKRLFDYFIVNNFDDTFLQQLEFILERELNRKVLKEGVTIFLSYNWSDKDKVDEVDNYLSQIENITVVRDVRNIGIWRSIKDFMKSIRDQDYAVLFISEMYLKSANCMYEILEIMKEKEYEKRIFPVVLNNSIYNPLVRLEYIKYWQNRYNELEEAINAIQISNIGGVLNELKRYKFIVNSIDDFLSVLIDMNNPQVKNIGEKIFEAIFNGN